MEEYRVKINEIVDEGEGRISIFFDVPEGFSWEVGSNIQVGVDGYRKEDGIDLDMTRRFSIFTTTDENRVGMTTKVSDSDYKKILCSMGVGDFCDILDNASHLPLRRENRPVVLISMGVGMAAMRPIILSYLNDKMGVTSITNIVINRSGNYLYKDELENLEGDGYRNICYKNREDFYSELSNMNVNSPIFYVVGSAYFLGLVIQTLKESGVDVDSIMIDKRPGLVNKIYDSTREEIEYRHKNNDYRSKFIPSINFKPIELPKQECGCGGNCTCGKK